MLHSGAYKALKRKCTSCYEKDTLSVDELVTHTQNTVAKNGQRREDFVRLIDQELLSVIPEGKVFFAEFGSGGRLECGPHSDMDLLIVAQDYELMTLSEHIKGRFDKILMEVDFKCIPVDELVAYKGDVHNPRPSRSYDADVILGDCEGRLKSAFNEQLIREVKNGGKGISRKLKSRVGQFRGICIKGGDQLFNGQVVKHFDLDEGILYYDPNEYIGSVKYGPLRMVQMRIAYDITRLIRRYDDPSGFMRELPSNTSQKLAYLEEENVGRLEVSELKELIYYYNYFLWLYHKSQYTYLNYHEKKIEVVNPIEVKEMVDNTVKLISGGLVK